MTDFEYKTIKSKRKTLSIEVKRDCSVIVRAPKHMRDKEIKKFIEQKRSWILKHIKQIEESKLNEFEKLSEYEIKELTALAKRIISKRAEIFAQIMNLSYNRITIRKQTTRWGSCSSKKNLSFNFLLILCPDDVQNYIVIHELCHLVHMNHSKEFWSMVESFCPDYNVHKKWLRDNGNSLIERIK